jgi:hypothetical protein
MFVKNVNSPYLLTQPCTVYCNFYLRIAVSKAKLLITCQLLRSCLPHVSLLAGAAAKKADVPKNVQVQDGGTAHVCLSQAIHMRSVLPKQM